MATSPTTQSATTSGAAKDDAVGLNGDVTFSIADLLANDPGGAAKISVDTQFKFGTTQEDWDDQEAYLADHGITDNGDGTFTINGGATDFQYMVQIGNKGTWSTADVDVTAPPHLGANLFTENFDGYEGQHYADNGVPVFAVVDLNNESGWTGATATVTELGADGYGDILDTSTPDATPATEGAYWLDTQNSTGPIDISNTFTDTTAAVDGVTSVLSFDVAKQLLDYLGNQYETAANASLEVRIDNVVVAQIDAADLLAFNAMQHFEIEIDGYANMGDDHTISIVDTSPDASYTGFSVDSIQINDWIL